MDITDAVDVFIPKLVQTTNFRGSEDTISCSGCGQEFVARLHCNGKRRKLIPCPKFYHHCLKQCSQYLSLSKCAAVLHSCLMSHLVPTADLHRHCTGCNKLFLKDTNFVYHLRSYKKCKAVYSTAPSDRGTPLPARPLPVFKVPARPAAVRTGRRQMRLTDVSAPSPVASSACSCGPCLSCSRVPQSPLLTDMRHTISAEQILHLTSCPTYRAVGDVRHCSKCDLSFIDFLSFDFHSSFVCPLIN